MRIGILALAIIFLMSGLKNLKDARSGEKNEISRRKLLFGVLMLVVCGLVLLYYLTSL